MNNPDLDLGQELDLDLEMLSARPIILIKALEQETDFHLALGLGVESVHPHL